MAFSVGKFIKSAVKDIGSRILDGVISGATSGRQMALISSADSTAKSLFNAGASFESISAFSAQKTDSVVNQSAGMYFALAGKDPARVASADLQRLRQTSTESLNVHLQEINPSTKIASKKRDASAIMDGIV